MTWPAYRRPPDVAVVDGEPAVDGGEATLYLAHLPSGPLLILEGSAALIWRAAVSPDWESDLVERVADQTGVDPDEIREDVETFVVDLVAQGLLERVHVANSEPAGA